MESMGKSQGMWDPLKNSQQLLPRQIYNLENYQNRCQGQTPWFIKGVQRVPSLIIPSKFGMASKKKPEKETERRLGRRDMKAQKTHCCMCCKVVEDCRDDALFCEGQCQKWLHRYCASVTVEQYEELSGSDMPFLCVTCCRSHHEHQISELRAEVEALSCELSELWSQIQSRPQTPLNMAEDCSRGGTVSENGASGKLAEKKGRSTRHGAKRVTKLVLRDHVTEDRPSTQFLMWN